MPPLLAILVWIWIAVSIVVLLRRHVFTPKEATNGVERNVDAQTEAEIPVPVGATAASRATATPAPRSEPPPGLVPVIAPTVERLAQRGAPAAGVAEALVGIRMPCDLVPLVFDRLATDRIALSTTGHRAEEVGTALADEIERLGYVLRPLSERELIATRGATELRLSIKAPDFDGRHLDHPSAREDAVVVEIALS